jgi:hypothetical protein
MSSLVMGVDAGQDWQTVVVAEVCDDGIYRILMVEEQR